MSGQGVREGIVFGVFVFVVSTVVFSAFSPGGWDYDASVIAVSFFLGVFAGRMAAGPPDR